ncbi:MAG: hypothetical protein A3204_02675 [Candidatus Methanarcanum hacksteinii]|nr:MAG: hypothetical protein A3204_02675 [Candidatus Methanarcanum hacksteinii]
MCDTSGYQQLSPDSKKSMYIGSLIWAIICLLAASIAEFFLMSADFYETWVLYIIVGIVAIIIVFLMIRPILFYDHYAYIVNSEKVDVRRGIFTITTTMVPIERIHQIEIKKGPINNLFGLSNVYVITAGGAASIEYLKQDVAEEIADELNNVVNKIIRSRDNQ